MSGTHTRTSLRRSVLLFLLALAAFNVPALWRWAHVDREPLDPLVAARAVGQGNVPVLGPKDAKTTIAFFTDYRCPICRASEAAIAAVMREDPDVRLVVRDWPILGPGSLAAARSSLAARDLPGYARFRQALIDWPGRLDRAGIDQAARHSGIDPVALAARERADKPAIDATLSENAALAGALGLPGTPGVVVGRGLVRGGVNAHQLGRLIAEAREERP